MTSLTRTHPTAKQADIDAMDADWKNTYLPAGYLADNQDDISLVINLIRELLKYEKSAMAKLVSPFQSLNQCILDHNQ
jgi:hypothetical protein